jgi:eukaryotic-like serine/threonine-protein kinase
MLSGPLERVFAIFDAAVARPEGEQAGFLADACRDDPGLREEVESLLAAHKEAEGFLSTRRPFPGQTHVEGAESPSPALVPGTRLSVFVVERFVGAGGMGEVYKARDTRLDRPVAIKVLPPGAAADPRARARFTYEARAIARLSHPRICALHDVGHDSVDFLVMEYLEGETLAVRLSRKALPLREAIRTAIEIAEALDAAHSRGIVHRDVKPGNVMLTASGVKLLDFGLARLRAEAGALSTMAGATLSETGSGIVMGTLQYMAPEQLEGKDVDARADIFSFGAVLYEMVTGRKAFEGKSQANLISAILSSPHPSATVTPLALDRVIRTCLEKHRDDRWTNMHDVQLQLQWIAQEGIAPAVEQTADITRRLPARWRRALPWTIAAVLFLGWMLMLGRWAPWKSTPTPSPQRLSVELGVGGTLPTTEVPFALSPDGALLVFAARGNGKAQLQVRRLDQLTATPLNGTEEASTPFFSPDAQWVAFFADAKLKKVPVTGGVVVTLADAPDPRGGWWAEDGTIVFAPHNRMGLMRVSSVGGPALPVTTLTDGEITHRYPQVLPGSKAVLYTASTEVIIGTGSTLVVQPLPSGERTIVQRGGYFGRYVASGHIVYMHDDTLFAMPFDLRRSKVTGPAASTLDRIKSDVSRGSAQLGLSQTGAMAYIPGRNTFDARPIAWVDRTGTLAALRAEPADWYDAEFSPDGRRIAMAIRGAGQNDIWVHDWSRGTLTRVTSETTNEESPVWTPDGAGLVYRSFRSSTDPHGNTIFWKRSDGTGDAQVLVHSEAALKPGSWHPNKRLLAYVATMAGTGDDVMILPVEGDEIGGWKAGTPAAFVSSAARERAPTFSPDGRWLSYTSNESGQDEVYVRPFPGPGARVMVSSTGGHTSSWSRARPEMVFTAPALDYTQVLMVARYRVENDSFLVDKPRLWAERGATVRTLLGSRMYALHPDGRRVAIAPPSDEETGARTHLTFVLNVFDELRHVAPAKP